MKSLYGTGLGASPSLLNTTGSVSIVPSACILARFSALRDLNRAVSSGVLLWLTDAGRIRPPFPSPDTVYLSMPLLYLDVALLVDVSGVMSTNTAPQAVAALLEPTNPGVHGGAFRHCAVQNDVFFSLIARSMMMLEICEASSWASVEHSIGVRPRKVGIMPLSAMISLMSSGLTLAD